MRQYCSRGFCIGMVFSRNFEHRFNLEEHVPSLDGEGFIFTFLMLHKACFQNITEFIVSELYGTHQALKNL